MEGKSGPFVVVLNHKCSIEPVKLVEVKEAKDHILSKEFEIMRRVIVEVQKGSKEGVRLNFHPKLRAKPLMHLTVLIGLQSVDKEYDQWFKKIFGSCEQKLTFNFESDIPLKHENEIDKTLKAGLRSLMLYDILFKLQQESERSKADFAVEKDGEHAVKVRMQTENLFTLTMHLAFSDISLQDQELEKITENIIPQKVL